MKIIIMHQTVTKHDAIGNDIQAMWSILKEYGECYVFADNQFNPWVEYISEDALLKVSKDSDNWLIYHHSVYWEKGEKILNQAKARIIFRYHNITPPEFFEPYNEFHTSQCLLGREQTKRLVLEYPDALWLCDSEYNSQDIIGVQRERIQICPPFHKIENWAGGIPDESVMEQLMFSEQINLLFVGRVAPNKGHLLLLDILQAYRTNYTESIHLWIIGKFDEGLAGYNQLIEERIEQYGQRDCVHFVGEINDAIISAYYLGCDAYVCVSDHEGFCVPIIESQYFKLPVIAKHSSAVPETLGKNQIVLGDDPKHYAAAIHLLNNQEEYRKWLREEGRKNYDDRFAFDRIKEMLLKAMRQWKIVQ